MDGDLQRIEEHKQFIEAWVRKKYPTVTDIAWRPDKETTHTHLLRFKVDGEKYRIVFPLEHLEDEGTESLLESILEAARPLRADPPRR
jgi:hypothetical protein